MSFSIPIKLFWRWDVIVIDRGPSGSMAAIAAVRQGVRTLVVEQHGFLPGASPTNLAQAGRAISATSEAAAAIRVTPIAIATGQGAGVTTAIARAFGRVSDLACTCGQRVLLTAPAILD